MPLTNTVHNLRDQRRLTSEHGEYVYHFPAVRCSCAATNDGHPLPGCAVCGGSGRSYSERRCINGLVGGLNTQDKALLQSGLAMPGDLTFSPDLTPTQALHDYDVIRLMYGLAYEGDVLTRGDDVLSYLPETITHVEQHDPHTGARARYRSPDDYVIDGVRVQWQPGRGPAVGSGYSVVYSAIFDWVVYPGVTLLRIKRGTHLGQRVLLRKRHLAGVTMVVPT